MQDMLELIQQNQIPEFSVSEISAEIKRCVETTFNKVRIKGEIFGAKRADSGHWYLSLKDENAVLSAVIWRGTASSLPLKPEDGLEVIEAYELHSCEPIPFHHRQDEGEHDRDEDEDSEAKEVRQDESIADESVLPPQRGFLSLRKRLLFCHFSTPFDYCQGEKRAAGKQPFPFIRSGLSCP